MKSSRPRSIVLLLALVAAAASILAIASASASSAAHAARTARATRCDISAVATTLGPTEVSSLKVTHARCRTGISVVKAFHRCRLKNGVSGRCVRLVQGFACRETRTNGPTEFSANVTCTKRRATVAHRYRQVIA